jgi:CDP-diacylglycerol--glycerol-3-phosphate 3-phosphatidyltransferase
VRTLPNAISIVRAIAVIPVVLLLDRPGAAGAALAVFAVAAASDAIDGPLARRVGAVTRLGAFIDPLADKILLLGTLVALLGHGAVDAWVVAVIVGREALATGLRGVAAGRGVSIEASAYGKAKTVLQAVAVAGLLLTLAFPTAEIAAAAGVALAGAVALTVASGIDLVLRAPSLLAVRRSPRGVSLSPGPPGGTRRSPGGTRRGEPARASHVR